MKFIKTDLEGAFLIETEPQVDSRGFFARSFCKKEFGQLNLKADLAQCNFSYNHEKATLRGMHYQEKPYGEVKLVSCLKGAIYDVIIDIRPESKTFGCHQAFELKALDGKTLYIPEGFAHGFETLEDDTMVYYQMMEFYNKDHARGIRWNDPYFNIFWPLKVKVISPRDVDFPLWK